VIEPSPLQRRNSQLKEIARLRAEGALTESEFEAVKAGLLSRPAGPLPPLAEEGEDSGGECSV
jgi:hypothetical protein